MVHALFAALAIGAVFAIYETTSSPGDASSSRAEASANAPSTHHPSTAAPAMPEARASDAVDRSPAGAVEGEVLEVLDVPQYTYARLGAKGSEGIWTAFGSAKVVVGQHLELRNASLMTDFTSKVLNRTFATIWFGDLDPGGTPATENPHAGMVGAMAPSAMGADEPRKNAVVAMHPVDRAPGPDGKTVAEIVSGRSALAGKTVRVRAIVVKKTTGVLGHDYLHVRDGSGDEADHTNDLSVTTNATPDLGDTVLLEGKLLLDVDIGSGYVFPTLLQDAKIVAP